MNLFVHRARGARALALAASIALAAVSCSSSEPADTADEATPPVDGVAVARSGGGTALLPLGDADALAHLQGFGIDPAPTVRITSPAPGEIFDGETLEVRYEVDNYDLGQDVGQHVHVILDDMPYKADYAPTGSVSFGPDELAPGNHVLTAFLSRPMHLALKSPGASDRVLFAVGAAAGETIDLDTPALVYSRPKGSYTLGDGGAAAIMLDFYVFGAELSPAGFRVRATVDGGEPIYVDAWAPRIVLTDPAPGEHTVRIELVDSAGEPVPGPFNDTTRTITIVE